MSVADGEGERTEQQRGLAAIIVEGLHSPGDRCSGTILVHPIAGFVPGKSDGLDVNLLYLGIGVLGARSARFQNDNWRHTVEATRPDLLIPIHWDDSGRSLDKKPRPMPRLLDKFAKTKELLDRKSAESGNPVRFQQPHETITSVQLSGGGCGPDRSFARYFGG